MRTFVVILALVLAACSSSADKQAAEHAAMEFHEMLDASQFDAIYAASAQDLKDVSKQEDFFENLKLRSPIANGGRLTI